MKKLLFAAVMLIGILAGCVRIEDPLSTQDPDNAAASARTRAINL
jgi:hypothetical protein